MHLGDSFDNGLLNLHCDTPASRIVYILRGNMELVVVVPCFMFYSVVITFCNLSRIRGMRERCAWEWGHYTVTIYLRIDRGVICN
jgi:hypothetical protein